MLQPAFGGKRRQASNKATSSARGVSGRNLQQRRENMKRPYDAVRAATKNSPRNAARIRARRWRGDEDEDEDHAILSYQGLLGSTAFLVPPGACHPAKSHLRFEYTRRRRAASTTSAPSAGPGSRRRPHVLRSVQKPGEHASAQRRVRARQAMRGVDRGLAEAVDRDVGRVRRRRQRYRRWSAPSGCRWRQRRRRAQTGARLHADHAPAGAEERRGGGHRVTPAQIYRERPPLSSSITPALFTTASRPAVCRSRRPS